MALKVELKPGERVIIGTCVVTNADQRTRLYIEGKAPVLREKDILTPATADTPAKRIYLAVQLMYIGESTHALQRDYFSLVNDIVAAAPSTMALVDEINNALLTASHYKALKAARRLIIYEQEILANAAAGSSRLP